MARSRKRRAGKGKYEYTSAKERARKRDSQKGSAAFDFPQDAEVWKPATVGKYYIDIIPYVVGEGNPFSDPGMLHYERTFYLHYNIGPKRTSYACLAETFGKPCPICEYRQQLERSNNASDELIRSLRPKERQLFNIIDLKEPDKGVQLWTYSYHNFGALLDELTNDEDEDYSGFYRLEDGYSLVLKVKKESMDQGTYLAVSRIDFKDRKEQYDDSILEETYCLDDLIKETPYDELSEAFHGGLSDDDEDEEDESPPSRRRTRRKPVETDEDEDGLPRLLRRRRQKPVETDDEEDDYDEEDEDEKPARRRRRKPVAEDDDDDEEDEDEKPAPKRKKKLSRKPKKSSESEDDDDDDDDDDVPF